MKRSNLGRASVAAMLIGLGAWGVGAGAMALGGGEHLSALEAGATQAQANQTSDQKLASSW